MESRGLLQLGGLLMCWTPETHLTSFPSLVTERGHRPQVSWEGLTCPSAGFHGGAVAEDEIEGLKKQRKEEENQEMTSNQEEAI